MISQLFCCCMANAAVPPDHRATCDISEKVNNVSGGAACDAEEDVAAIVSTHADQHRVSYSTGLERAGGEVVKEEVSRRKSTQ